MADTLQGSGEMLTYLVDYEENQLSKIFLKNKIKQLNIAYNFNKN